MAVSTVKEIILAAATDSEFRERFFQDPEAVLSQYELTDEEKQCLREKANLEALELAAAEVQSEAMTCANDIRI